MFKGSDRAVARSENPGGHIVLGGDNVPPLVEIGLTDLPKSGCAMAYPAHPGTTGLQLNISWTFLSSKLDSPVIKTLERHSLKEKKYLSDVLIPRESNFDERNVQEMFN